MKQNISSSKACPSILQLSATPILGGGSWTISLYHSTLYTPPTFGNTLDNIATDPQSGIAFDTADGCQTESNIQIYGFLLGAPQGYTPYNPLPGNPVLSSAYPSIAMGEIVISLPGA